jgi:hypothetical protein
VPFELVTTLVDPQPPEELAVALEKFLNGIKQKSLAKPPRSGQEAAVAGVSLKKIVDIPGLVGVDKVSLPNFPKGRSAQRQICFLCNASSVTNSWKYASSQYVRGGITRDGKVTPVCRSRKTNNFKAFSEDKQVKELLMSSRDVPAWEPMEKAGRTRCRQVMATACYPADKSRS